VTSVKQTQKKRSYVSSVRTEQAEATRSRIITAANSCFSESGWSGTTLAQIAERAGVTPQAVHLSVGSKPALLMAALGQAIAGGVDGRPNADRPSFERALFRDALQADATDAGRARAFAAATAAIHESAGPLFEVLAQAEQTDPDLRRRRAEIKERRLQLVRGMVRASGRRRGAAFDRLVDVIYALSSTSLHNEFASRGWARKVYQNWLADELTRLLEGR
jgi:AcrR family transcriptional regulator